MVINSSAIRVYTMSSRSDNKMKVSFLEEDAEEKGKQYIE